MDHKEINNIPMFFIVGRARSGTTLLQTLLDSNPSAIVPYESCVIMHLKSKYAGCKNWSKHVVDEFLKDILLERKLKRTWHLNIENIREQILKIPDTERTYALISKILYLNFPSIFEQNTIKLIGDKNPIYTLFISDLIELFPEAKFIHIVRDYRANIASNRDVFSLKGISSLAHSWVYHNKAIEKIKAKYPDRFLLIKYEDLARLPEVEMKKICDFLKIPYHSESLKFHEVLNEKFENKIDSRTLKIHGNLLKPVNSDRIDAWKETLSEQEIKLAEYVCGEFGKKYRYLTSAPKEIKFSYYKKSILGNINCRYTHAIIQAYYHSPLIIKKIIARATTTLYNLFKIKNYYNQSDFN